MAAQGGRVELSLDGAIAKGSDDRGGEEGIAIASNDETEVHETAEDDLEIHEDTENVPPGWLDVELGVTDVLSKPGLDEGPLVIGQPPGFLGKVGGEEEHDNGASNSRETL